MTLDQQINSMAPGASLAVSHCGDVRVFVERSGDGRTLRFVRQRGCVQTVFKTTSFAGETA